jgi:hypothetical protein
MPKEVKPVLQERIRGVGDIDKTIDEIHKAMRLALKAHLQKKKFIQRLMEEPGTPMWQVGMGSFDKKPYLEQHFARCEWMDFCVRDEASFR